MIELCYIRLNKCGVSIKVTHLVSNQEKIGQYNHSAPKQLKKEIYNEHN